MEVEIRPTSAMSSSTGTEQGSGVFFTEADLAAADQLVQLSVSGEAASPTWTSSSSSPSVNNKDTTAAEVDVHDDDGGGGHGVPWVDRRARKRYRLVAELYDATRPVGGGVGGKRGRSEEEEAAITDR